MEVHVHANCQAVPIAGMLREANSDWRITWFETHGQEIVDRLQEHRNRIRVADLVISQPIHRGYRDVEELSVDWIRDNIRRDATLLVVPSMHFAGHHPGLDSLPLPGVPFLSNLLAAHFVASGCTPKESVRCLLSDDLLRESDVDAEIQLSLDESVRRERDDHIDIKISSFLRENCRSRAMFHIQNHPFRETTVFIVNRILARLGQPERVPVEGLDYQYDTHLPPLPSVARYLRFRRRETAESEADETVRLPGFPSMTQAEYYTVMTERLSAFGPDEVFDAIEGRWPTIQVLRRLARNGSPIPGIARWLES